VDLSAFWFGVVGLELSEAAYMSEIVGAGIRSVGEGQTEAAMRVIIPPTGAELIGMPMFDPVPLLLVAPTWNLAITSVLVVGQYFLEQYFSREISRTVTTRQLRVRQEQGLRTTGEPP
jgi:polar amino acid transport system permease protein